MISSKRLVLVLGATAISSVFTAACGNGDDSESPAVAVSEGGTDAGSAGLDASGSDSTVDAPASDSTLPDSASSNAADDGAADANPADGSPAADTGLQDSGLQSDAADGGLGRLLVPGATLRVDGVTADDNVIYYESSSQTYYAVPIAGGDVTTIYAAPLSTYANNDVEVFGNVAIVWSYDSDYIGTPVSWSSGMARGAPLTSKGLAYLYQTVWASEDGKHVAYLESASADNSVGVLYGANADGTGRTLLLPAVDIQVYDIACFPRLVFRGDAAVVSYCGGADAGSTPMIQAFSVASGWAPGAAIANWVPAFQFNLLDRSPQTFSFAVDPDGGRIAAATSASGALQIFPVGGGDAAVLDPGALVSSSLSFAGSVTNPWSLFYNDDAGVLTRTYVDNPTPQTLVDAGANYFNAFSKDGRWMLVSSGENGGWFSDMSLVSTQNPATPVLIASSAQYGNLPVAVSTRQFGESVGFTTDNAYAITTTNLVQSSQSTWVGYLRAMAVASPGTTTLLSNGYLLGYHPLRGSKILVTDNFQDTDGGSAPTVDLDVVDPANSAAPVHIATNIAAGANGVSGDLSQVAYSIAYGPAPGIYVSPLP